MKNSTALLKDNILEKNMFLKCLTTTCGKKVAHLLSVVYADVLHITNILHCMQDKYLHNPLYHWHDPSS